MCVCMWYKNMYIKNRLPNNWYFFIYISYNYFIDILM